MDCMQKLFAGKLRTALAWHSMAYLARCVDDDVVVVVVIVVATFFCIIHPQA